VWIVEGGVDALALHTLFKISGKEPPPTVLVSGGAGVRCFLGNSTIQSILRDAELIVICTEREKDPLTQAKTDADHRKQAARVLELTGKSAKFWTPGKAKDVADHLLEVLHDSRACEVQFAQNLEAKAREKALYEERMRKFDLAFPVQQQSRSRSI
jgi:hypothetical protein